jgi:iron complex outermembrane recepter protein
MLHPRIATLLACAAFLTLTATPGSAQPAPGKISGAVRVASGAPVAGAPITIANQETGATRVVRSSSTGAYEATGLPPGLYTVSADVQGFRKVVHKDQRLAAGAALPVDFSLEVRASADVTVTAMKREDTVASVPVSIAAPTEDVLRDLGATNIEDVAANVPGLSVQNLGPGQSEVSIRGVSSGQIARDLAGIKEQVGSYLDESVMSLSLFTPDIDLFDVNRVEVLRGPQGTLFGSGSLSGTVRYISNQPELGVTRFFGELTGNAISGGSQSGDVKMGFNLPLGDMAALRVAGYFDHSGGYMDAVQPNLSVKKDVNTSDRAGVRAAIDFAPDEHLTIIPRFVYQNVKADGWNRIDIYNILANPYTTTRPKVTLGERELFTQINEPFTDKFMLADLNVKYNFGDVTLTSITSYTHRDILVVRDAGALTSSITGGSYGEPESVYTLNAPLNDSTKAHGWTEEVRLSSDKGRFKWVVGGFYTDSKRDYAQDLPVTGFEAAAAAAGKPHNTTGIIAPKDNLYFSTLNYKLQQYALFGEGTYAVTDRFSVTAGLRYYNFKEDKKLLFDGFFVLDAAVGTTIVSQPGSTKADGFAPRFIVSYKVSDSTTLNAQASKGFRLGGINDPINLPLCQPADRATFGGHDAFDDETAWNYEVGSKSRLFGGKGSINVSAFYVDISDLQVIVTAGSCSSRLIYNTPKARSVGGEVEFAMAPTRNFDFSLSAGYADAQIRSTISGSPGLPELTGIVEGNRLPSVPKFQASASATYQGNIGHDITGYVTGAYQHVGSRYTQLADQEPGAGTVNIAKFGTAIGGPLTQSTFTFDPLLPAYDLVNLRLGIRQGVYEIALFVNNLTDERAFLALDRERGPYARVGYLTNQPRTAGLTMRLDF